MTDQYAELRAALAAGPTPGPWFSGGCGGDYCVYDKRCWVNDDGSRGGETPNMVVVVSPAENTATAHYIAAANPGTISALLKERDALHELTDSRRWYSHQTMDAVVAEREALRGERDALLSLLREIVEVVEERDDQPEWFWLQDARDAIERAEGGEA